MKIYKDVFDKIISLENLFSAWDKFKSDKRNKRDVQKFEWNLEQNIFRLHRDLKLRRYAHGNYTSFYIHDPKQRHIHKATVRDRVLHHAIFTVLNPIFESTFIATSFSCRVGKGTHKGVGALNVIARRISSNNFKSCFVLKCDIKRFFDTVDHETLLKILKKKIGDDDAMRLLEAVIESFHPEDSTPSRHRGLPIGNLTSQLFANIYLSEFDYFVKHDLKEKHYLRYTDDFVIVAGNRHHVEKLIFPIQHFLGEKLFLELHPKKVSIRKFIQGADFLGYVLFPHHRLLRTKTKNRIFRKLRQRIAEHRNGSIGKETVEQSLQSYLGVLSHANAHNLSQELINNFWFWLNE